MLSKPVITTRVVSSQIEGIATEECDTPLSVDLVVFFHRGGAYRYREVGEDLVREMLAAPSVASYFAANIKSGHDTEKWHDDVGWQKVERKPASMASRDLLRKMIEQRGLKLGDGLDARVGTRMHGVVMAAQGKERADAVCLEEFAHVHFDGWLSTLYQDECSKAIEHLKAVAKSRATP